METITIGISAEVNYCDSFFFIGVFKVRKNIDLRRFAAIKCKRFADERQGDLHSDWIKRLERVEVYDFETLENILTVII